MGAVVEGELAQGRAAGVARVIEHRRKVDAGRAGAGEDVAGQRAGEIDQIAGTLHPLIARVIEEGEGLHRVSNALSRS